MLQEVVVWLNQIVVTFVFETRINMDTINKWVQAFQELNSTGFLSDHKFVGEYRTSLVQIIVVSQAGKHPVAK